MSTVESDFGDVEAGSESSQRPSRNKRKTGRMQEYEASKKKNKINTEDEREFEKCIEGVGNFMKSDKCPDEFKSFLPLFLKFADLVSTRLEKLEMKSLTKKDMAAAEIKQKEVDQELAGIKLREAELVKKLSIFGEETEKSVKELREIIEKNKEPLSQSRMDTGEKAEDPTEDFMRARSVVISGLTPPSHLSDFEVSRRLPNVVNDILRILDIPTPPVEVYRMGKHLVKVRFSTTKAQKMVLARAPQLRGSEYWKCFIRPSLTPMERVERAKNYQEARSESEKRGREEDKKYSIRPLPGGIKFELVARRPPRPSSTPYRPILNSLAPYYSNTY